MEEALRSIHTFKEVFLLNRAGKQITATDKALRVDQVKKQTVDKETNADSSTPSKEWCEMNA